MTITTLDPITIENLDWELACEGPLEPKCGLPSQVIPYLRCGCFWMMSWRCRDRDREVISNMGPRVRHHCPRCGFEFGAVTRWEELVVREVPF